jgi:hypothetical protein
MLKYVQDEDIVYFHNLAYDFTFLAGYGCQKMCKHGTKNLGSRLHYFGKHVNFRDSLAMIQGRLAEFPKYFGLKNIKKEKYPYIYYSEKYGFKSTEGTPQSGNGQSPTLTRDTIGVISEAGKYEENPWTEADYKEFIENIDNIPGCRIDDDHFNMFKYAEFYCIQDCRILQQGFMAFRKKIKDDFDIDVVKYVSISSVADALFKKYLYYPNKNIYKIGGIALKFCRQSIRGGRCMTALNKSYHIRTPIVDLDARALYPSAMDRLYIVEGTPTAISDDK